MSAPTVTIACAPGSLPEPAGRAAAKRLRSGYGVSGRQVRGVALIGTVLVHLAVGAVVAIGWPRMDSGEGAPHLVSIVIVPRAEDEPRHRPTSGAQASHPRPKPAPAASSPPPTILLAAPQPAALAAVAVPPAPPDGGGREDTLGAVTEAYRRAMMARLETTRSPVSQDRARTDHGGGEVVFRIERSGRLLDVTMARSTGRTALDRAALDVVRRAAPFPVIPDALPDELTITLPVEFLMTPRLLPAMSAGR